LWDLVVTTMSISRNKLEIIDLVKSTFYPLGIWLGNYTTIHVQVIGGCLDMYITTKMCTLGRTISSFFFYFHHNSCAHFSACNIYSIASSCGENILLHIQSPFCFHENVLKCINNFCCVLSGSYKFHVYIMSQ
jgi:hypothetical protein